MGLSEPVLSGPRAGRTVTYGGGSSAELKLVGGQSALPKNVPHGLTVRGDQARLLATPEGRVIVSVYSSGAIGRLVPEDVIGLVTYVREHAAMSGAAVEREAAVRISEAACARPPR